jgi:hypothetical protein
LLASIGRGSHRSPQNGPGAPASGLPSLALNSAIFFSSFAFIALRSSFKSSWLNPSLRRRPRLGASAGGPRSKLVQAVAYAIIKAESAGKLNKRYERLAKQAHIVVSANVIVEMENGKPVHAYEAKIKERFGRHKSLNLYPSSSGAGRDRSAPVGG